jgi:hypothetical protein
MSNYLIERLQNDDFSVKQSRAFIALVVSVDGAVMREHGRERALVCIHLGIRRQETQSDVILYELYRINACVCEG